MEFDGSDSFNWTTVDFKVNWAWQNEGMVNLYIPGSQTEEKSEKLQPWSEKWLLRKESMGRREKQSTHNSGKHGGGDKSVTDAFNPAASCFKFKGQPSFSQWKIKKWGIFQSSFHIVGVFSCDGFCWHAYRLVARLNHFCNLHFHK